MNRLSNSKFREIVILENKLKKKKKFLGVSQYNWKR